MLITADHVVSMHYTLTAPDGEVLDTSAGKAPLTYLHGHGNIISGLERQLEGRGAGERLVAAVPAAEAYGERDPGLVVKATRDQFPADAALEPGMRFHADTPEGTRVAQVTHIEGEHVTVDINHPLAGVDLTFTVEIVEVRTATNDEIDHGHVHGDGCCH